MSWMFIVFYVFKQSLKPGEKQQTNLLIFFFSNTSTVWVLIWQFNELDSPYCRCFWNMEIAMSEKAINSVTGGKNWVLPNEAYK